MKLILGHPNTDLDALACQIAARRLHPGAVLGRCRRLSRPVRDFLALHKDRFDLTGLPQLDLAAVDHLILVDFRRAGRMAEIQPLVDRALSGDPSLTVEIWDHHDAAPDDLHGALEVIEPVGAAATLFVEAFQARGIRVDPVEATALALGIYADTGSLGFACTTPRDIAAAAWLVAAGASPRVIARFLAPPMSPEQREALSELWRSLETVDIAGVPVAVGIVPTARRVDGLSQVATVALEHEACAALFAVFHDGRQVQVVGRSRVRYVDIGDVLQDLGGGGHPAAGAAMLKGADPLEVRDRLLAALRAAPPRPRRVRDMMSAPVHTICHDTPLRGAQAAFEAHDISGAPVTRDGRVVGIVSRRDISHAERDGRGELRVSSCMAHVVRSVTPDATLEQALSMLVEHDIGRLPVLEDGHLAGIVTRSDLLRFLYDGR